MGEMMSVMLYNHITCIFYCKAAHMARSLHSSTVYPPVRPDTREICISPGGHSIRRSMTMGSRAGAHLQDHATVRTENAQGVLNGQYRMSQRVHMY
ncbi:hypothetical protein OBBRIDRAFT_90586 [Obba rivulosa]|uniref:Uncharacterized protein n=1 Tax=Obba rivulosa TaxID=1052685 RepID=A0A8E2AXE1_9APHY|nr:hypothetical protein OBBRIDRAFT_90586 [Obba rivulosa]